MACCCMGPPGNCPCIRRGRDADYAVWAGHVAFIAAPWWLPAPVVECAGRPMEWEDIGLTAEGKLP